MILEIRARWPFVVRRHDLEAPAPRPVAHAHHSVPAHAHRSWVRTTHGVGWIHHHEHDGYVIELQKGGTVKCATGTFKHIEAPR